MPVSNPAASSVAAAQPRTPDTQTLITLLGNLMPLLLRLQASPLDQSFPFGQSGPLGPLGQLGQIGPYGELGPLGPPIPLPNPALDQQAAVSFVEDITAESLRALSTFLEAQVGQQAGQQAGHQAGRQEGRYPGLETCVPIVTRAAQCFAMRDYAQAFGLIWQAYRVIAAVRAANPQLPPVRTVAAAGTTSAQSSAVR